MTRARILVVDDLPENLRALQRLLGGVYAVTTAPSGEEALAAVERNIPDLVLLDIGLPGLDGFEVLDRLRADERTRSVPVIFLTGSHAPEDEARGIERGAVDFITKPFNGRVVLSRVQNHVYLAGVRARLEQLSNKLGKYVSPQLVQSIFQGTQDVQLGTQRKKLTVFFSDIVGFTERTDNLEPEELTQLLNRYLNRMADLVLSHGGTLDKFIGDSVMVFFGDPTTRGPKEDALACLEMAFQMRLAVEREMASFADNRSDHPFQVRIGIATGYCTVGNFGSESRMDYTIVGNHVNLASRLESNAKPGQILIAHETWALVHEEVYCVQVAPIHVKGFSQPVPVFEAIDFRTNVVTDGGLSVSVPGFSLALEPHALEPRDREAVREALRTALHLVETPGATAPPASTRFGVTRGTSKKE